ncbi:MAG: ABC-2 family transporter protein [Anaerolineae bacterium]|jgi:ABC-2 type transport system permease protein
MMRYAFVLRTAAQRQLTYRAEFAMRAISMVLFMGVFIALWTAAFGVSGRAELAGYSLVEVVWYLAMTETITLSTSRIFVEISEAVKTGDLAYTLTRPLSYPLFQVANSLGNSAPRFVLNLLTAGAVVWLSMGQAVSSLPALAAFLVMAALALLLDALMAVLIGLLAFWIEEVTPVFWIYQKLLFTVGGMFLPLEMFPDWLRRAVMWLPFQFITYAPARTFVAFEPQSALRAAIGQVGYVAGLAVLMALVWRRAQRRLVVHGG